MSVRKFAAARVACRMASAVMVFVVVAACSSWAPAQIIAGQRSVGGVKFLPDGMLVRATRTETAQLRREILQRMSQIPGALSEHTEMRTISLAKIDAAMRHSQQTGEELPEAIRYLGGLQRVDYVLVLPEEHDVVLIGPAEGWRVDDGGNLVGVSTGKTVLLLDDLLTALRAVSNPRPSVFSCSIDPSAEGRVRLASFARSLRPGVNPQLAAARIEQVLGPQMISTTGVPGTSHFARVMVAADYRMKEIGMGLEPAPVEGLPSYLQMVRSSSRGSSSLAPRWWLEPDYEPLVGDAAGHCWKLPAGTVKAMTENDFFDASGEKRQTGKADVISQRWADMLTDRYEALAQADPVFAQLKDCIDLSIVATLIVRKDLLGEAGIELPMLMKEQPTAELPAPTAVASRAAVLRKSRVMIACGGVQINPWDIVDNAETNDEVASIRGKVTLDETNWWSN